MEKPILQYFDKESLSFESIWYNRKIMFIIRSEIYMLDNNFVTCFCIVLKKKNVWDLIIIDNMLYCYDTDSDLRTFLFERINNINDNTYTYNLTRYKFKNKLVKPIYNLIQSEINKWYNSYVQMKFYIIYKSDITDIHDEILKKIVCVINPKKPNIYLYNQSTITIINQNSQININYFIVIPNLRKPNKLRKSRKSIKHIFPYYLIYKSVFDNDKY